MAVQKGWSFMNTLYEILEKLLPYSWIEYDFIKNAFLAIIIITPLFGILGTMIVNNKMAFFSDALGHSALTGVAIGVIFGMSETTFSMIIYAAIFALLMNSIKRKRTLSTDTIISVFASFSMAIGLVILSIGGNFSQYSSLLVGDVLSISKREIIYLLITFVITLVFWLLCFNKLHAMSVNETLARSKNVKTKLLDNLFVVLIAIIVMLSIKWIGILIINALLILPAASSRNIASNVREYHLFSVIISVFSGIVGLILSYYINTATGPTIVIIASVFFFLTYLLKRSFK